MEVSAAKALWMSDHATQHPSDLFIALCPFLSQALGNVTASMSEIYPNLGFRSFSVSIRHLVYEHFWIQLFSVASPMLDATLLDARRI